VVRGQAPEQDGQVVDCVLTSVGISADGVIISKVYFSGYKQR